MLSSLIYTLYVRIHNWVYVQVTYWLVRRLEYTLMCVERGDYLDLDDYKWLATLVVERLEEVGDWDKIYMLMEWWDDASWASLHWSV